MNKTSLKQKFFLFVFALSLAAILLEIGLRLAGGIVLYLQERHNHLSFDHNVYRILCLGESTTALGGEDSYPSQLAKMLNAQGLQKKFYVINKGIISTTTKYILERLDQNLDTYKPQLVILMMGINDKAYLQDTHSTLWWENIKSYLKDLKVYKLAHILYEHITHRIKELNAPAAVNDSTLPDNGNDQQIENFLKIVIIKNIEQAHQGDSQSIMEASLACIELAHRYQLQGFFQEAQKILEQATKLTPSYTGVYQEWGELYLAQGKSLQAQKAFQAAIALDPKNSDALLGLAHAYYQEHNGNAFLAYAVYLQKNRQDYWGYVELAQWLRANNRDDLAENFLVRAIAIGPDFDQAYVDLGQLYHNQGKEELSKNYFQQAAQHQTAGFYNVTFVNYGLILNKILSRHIKVIAMQYPIRDISPLKNVLGERNNVIFVENKRNFKKALDKRGYNYYFKDNFAYDFGHCTREGNALIAQNLTEVILKQVLNSQQ